MLGLATHRSFNKTAAVRPTPITSRNGIGSSGLKTIKHGPLVALCACRVVAQAHQMNGWTIKCMRSLLTTIARLFMVTGCCIEAKTASSQVVHQGESFFFLQKVPRYRAKNSLVESVIECPWPRWDPDVKFRYPSSNSIRGL